MGAKIIFSSIVPKSKLSVCPSSQGAEPRMLNTPHLPAFLMVINGTERTCPALSTLTLEREDTSSSLPLHATKNVKVKPSSQGNIKQNSRPVFSWHALRDQVTGTGLRREAQSGQTWGALGISQSREATTALGTEVSSLKLGDHGVE